MTNIVINTCPGYFALSEKAMVRFVELGGGIPDGGFRKIARHDPILLQVVRELGQRAGQREAGVPNVCFLEIVEIPGNIYRVVVDNDGVETVETPTEVEWVIADHV